jgi:hypothetical protein
VLSSLYKDQPAALPRPKISSPNDLGFNLQPAVVFGDARIRRGRATTIPHLGTFALRWIRQALSLCRSESTGLHCNHRRAQARIFLLLDKSGPGSKLRAVPVSGAAWLRRDRILLSSYQLGRPRESGGPMAIIRGLMFNPWQHGRFDNGWCSKPGTWEGRFIIRPKTGESSCLPHNKVPGHFKLLLYPVVDI